MASVLDGTGRRRLCPLCNFTLADCVEKGTCPGSSTNAVLLGQRRQAELVKLVPRDNMPNAALVEMLEKLLGYAQKGELREIAVACIWDDNRVSHGYTKSDSFGRMLGSIANLQMAYFRDHE